MIKLDDRRDCCGCSACASICPQSAISMLPDGLGFLYPSIDMDKCVNCGLCERVCSFNDDYDNKFEIHEPIAYGARHKEYEQVLLSQSGAAFVAISDIILNSGGVVYGAAFGNHFSVIHERASTMEERDKFRGSKYVQSDLRGVFQSVKKDLQSGMKVLFSGTPCQVSGLASYIGNCHKDNLYLVDIVCHGVASPGVWQEFLNYLEKKRNKAIMKVNFRDKNFGWASSKETFIFEGEKGKQKFKYHFYRNLYFRPSCSKCHFANIHRPGDITIGDFWGHEKVVPDFYPDNKGISIILVNTDKGKRLFDEASCYLDIVPISIDSCLQPNMKSPTLRDSKANKFEDLFLRYGFENAAKKLSLMGWRYDIIKRPVLQLRKIYHQIRKG
ncbi:MAG: Coenzyme F420 hydrogenase/dehydrogenase, beta subunit C-terminal domain [Bacteroidales bacterium]|jgi:coenzyme F420-reducing hydrogenase beta subunit|nr:Coenzyme F420 hydrogenase/dehydrogenase, beta subunit C-terminal domain [Bacteroidales bacterium]